MFIADLHIHSRFSRATSRDCDAPHLDLWARRKGIALIGTGDFTHPAWRAELSEMLEPAEEGLYRLRSDYVLPAAVAGQNLPPRFVVSGEISTIYKRGGKTRKVHHVLLLPGLQAAEELSHRLEAIGNLHSDGRPILGLDSRDLLEIVLTTCPDAIYIPAHIWTPHFSLFGAFSDFSSIEECYGDLAPYVHAMETGLSSDPLMNRRLSMLDSHILISNSDAHSPAKLGREANVLDCELSYPALKRAIETGEGFSSTIEFYPEEGKYHWDGHRNCNCCMQPAETIERGGLCPVCGHKVTVGVAHRVELLADRAQPITLSRPFESIIPLQEVVADCLGVSPASKRAQAAYFDLIERFGDEFSILRTLPLELLDRQPIPLLSEAIGRMRNGRVIRTPGYDGAYGVIRLFEPGETQMLLGQTSLIGLAGTERRNKNTVSTIREAKPESEMASPSPAPSLNAAQREAVESQDGVIAVIAGPGTGKTKTLVARIAHLIENKHVPPSHITAVTFTRQAAQEMRQRLTQQLGKSAVRGLTIGTFHSVCLSQLDQKPLISDAQANDIIATLLEEHEEKRSVADCRQQLSLYKNALRTRSERTADLPSWLPDAYAKRLELLGMRDLDDILLEALEAPSCKRMFTHLLVDEFQDINDVQLSLMLHWSRGSQSLFAIGDPDQAIYGFRGANAGCFDALLAARPNTRIIQLVENYRSTPQVLSFGAATLGRANALHANHADGAAVRLMTAGDGFSEGMWIAKEIARITGGTDMLEAQAIGNARAVNHAFSDIAVLCRTRRQLEQIEECLVHDSIPCTVCGRDQFADNSTAQGILSFFCSLVDPANTQACAHALRTIWHVPDALCQRACVALSAGADKDEQTQQALLATEADAFEVLRSWANAAIQLKPLLFAQKPRKLLEQMSSFADVDNKTIGALCNASVFHATMQDMLEAFMLGEESDVRRTCAPIYSSGAVQLMTLHASKGLEFPVVFIAGINEGVLPLERMNRSNDIDEERRLFYVGITRAKEELILSHGGTPSCFLTQLPSDVRISPIRTRKRAPKAQQLTLFDL